MPSRGLEVSENPVPNGRSPLPPSGPRGTLGPMRRFVVAGLGVVSLGIAACGGVEDPPALDSVDFTAPVPVAFRPEAVRAPQTFADVAKVSANEIRVPRSGASAEVLARVVPGTILASNRSASAANTENPYGFLRKVVEVKTVGEEAVLVTEPAYLDQLLSEGDLVWGEGGTPSIFGDDPAPGVQTKAPTPSGVANGSTTFGGEYEADPDPKVKFRPVVGVSNAKISLGTKFTGELKLRKALGIPYGVKRASARVDFDPLVAADFRYGVKVVSAASSQGGALDKRWEGPSVAIPVSGPIPMTVRLRPELRCTLTVTGEVSATSRLELRGHAAAGFVYDGGTDIQVVNEPPTLSAQHQFLGVTAKAGMTGECTVQAVVSLLAFDAAGFEVKLGPYAQLTGEACVTVGNGGDVGGGFALWEQHGLRIDAGGRLQVPGLGFPSVSKDLLTLRPIKSDPHYFVGNANTCTPNAKDTCVGKVDGLYCSELAAFGAYACKNGSIVGGQQCASPKVCAGPNGPGSTIVCR